MSTSRSRNSDPCKPQACAIQDCLKRTSYNESKCTKLIDKLYSCCSKFYQENGDEAKTVCCPIPRLLKFKIEQRQKEKIDAEIWHHNH
ncbi:Cmc4p [Ascoidea rubescens DSM 1968]|uniref:Cx9C motif-containing protein 4, mitochondrial n=1 Tax=Ascoidea rubescens DSM 1968 TaxID=1344418 RepID=A0A1D2V877_9ASCO|nr:Cx9C motif-containing protein 4, mitochondrial [Ascoidea rubescens DSM 1968]ODV57832.1 Cx9C motif-containing protein 4, mitochondrial [Ascoidea rubescens DSM 1968]